MGSERSGSNLLTKIFDSHPEVCGPNTSHVGDVIIPCLYRYGDLKKENWSRLLDDAFNLLNSKNAVWEYSFTKKELKENIAQGDIGGLFRYIYQMETEANHKKIAFVKENRIYEFAIFLTEHFEEAQYVYMIRDPRDMAASWKHSHAIRGGAVKASNTWKKDQTGFSFMRAAMQDKKKIPAFKYEDLIQYPEKTLDFVCGELKLKFHPGMLDFHMHKRTQANALAAAEWKNISSPIIQNNFGNYPKKLTADEILYIESLCYTEMKAFGYEPNFSPISGTDFDDLELKLTALEPVEKEGYKLVSEGEKKRRKTHYQKSSEIRQRQFILNGLFEMKSFRSN